MSLAEDLTAKPAQLISAAQRALAQLGQFFAEARMALDARVRRDGRLDAGALDAAQHAAHGLAWLATYIESLRQLAAYAERLDADGSFGEIERLICQIAFGEYLSQIAGGIAMSQGEFVRPMDFGLSHERVAALTGAPGIAELIGANTTHARARLIELIVPLEGGSAFADAGLDDTLVAFREEMHRFAAKNVAPYAHSWHLDNELIPLSVIAGLGDLGVFGLTIPEEYGGLGVGKQSMCVVSEELARAYISVGSMGTRAEIAGELILASGTEAQKTKWLPKIASGEVLATAVFTEPNTGSDLASLTTRAVRDGEVYRITGNKTWITHPVRADLMTLLARTDPGKTGYEGLSMFLAEKPRGSDDDPFPAPGMSGSEIEVIGYRGMREYEIAFDGFEVKTENLLGGEEGQGFKQLMQTFESARIQTAARAVGVAQSAMDLGLRYAIERHQFGKAIVNFPRVSDKIAMMAAEIMVARQLTYFAARQKDQGRRCDLEAGMAKLLAARIAWAAADNAVQIHGGNGFSLEYQVSRVLCDARILSIFEGAAEIQAQIVAKRILEGGN